MSSYIRVLIALLFLFVESVGAADWRRAEARLSTGQNIWVEFDAETVARTGDVVEVWERRPLTHPTYKEGVTRRAYDCKARTFLNKRLIMYSRINGEPTSVDSATLSSRPEPVAPDTLDAAVLDLLCSAGSSSSAPKAGPAAPPKSTVSFGTGFTVSSRGHVITNYHVVAHCWKNGAIHVHDRPARPLASDEKNDLALLLADVPGTQPAVFRGEDVVRVGESVIVVGFPLPGLLSSDLIATTGTLSSVSGPRNDPTLFQISAPVQQGNSGGPLLDEKGSVIGVVVGKLNALRVAELTGDIPQNVNFAVSLPVLKHFLQANRVPYNVFSPSKAPAAPQLVDYARRYAYPIKCTEN